MDFVSPGYMLNKVNFKLTYSQISGFILEKEYTNFLTLQQVISDRNGYEAKIREHMKRIKEEAR